MLGLFSLEKRRFKGRSYQCVKMLDRRRKDNGGTLLSACPMTEQEEMGTG